MRHIYIRGILALVWLAAAVISGMSGSFETALLYLILGGMFFYSTHAAWKKEKSSKGDR